MKCRLNWSDSKWGINGTTSVFTRSKFVKGTFIRKWKLVEISRKDSEYRFVTKLITKPCECIFKKKMRRPHKSLFKPEHCHITTIKGNISEWRRKLLMRRNRSTAKLRNKVCKNLAKFVSWLTNLFHSETKINWYALLLQKFHPKITDGFL